MGKYILLFLISTIICSTINAQNFNGYIDRNGTLLIDSNEKNSNNKKKCDGNIIIIVYKEDSICCTYNNILDFPFKLPLCLYGYGKYKINIIVNRQRTISAEFTYNAGKEDRIIFYSKNAYDYSYR